ncbi:hypothetical protein BDY24DRAFT_375329 [Mrakia frigida]|uniref:uncharacterized protein n=1 Tax=Mrakia frigida TaxID=29902 RepID=UPI003FCC2371
MAFSSTRARIYRTRSLLPSTSSPVFRPSPISSSPRRASSSKPSSSSTKGPPPAKSSSSPLDAPRPPPPTTPLGRAHSLAKTYLPHLTALFTAIKEKDKAKILPTGSVRPPRKDPVLSFREALKSGRYHGIGPAYLESMAELEEGEFPSISEEEVRAAVQLLSRSRDEHQWTIIDTMIEDLSLRYQSSPTHLDYRAILRFLANSPTPRAAFPRLETIPLSIPISIIDFNIVLGGLSRAGDEEALRSAMEQVAILDLTPDRQTFHLYLNGLFLARAQAGLPPPLPSSSQDDPTSISTSTSPLSSDVDSTLRKMSALRLPPSSATYSILAEGYRRLGDEVNTAKALELVRSTLSGEMSVVRISSDGRDVLGVVPWNSLVAAASIEKSLKDGIEVVEKMKEAGVEPDEGTIDALLRGISVRKMSEVLDIAKLLESETNVELFARHWGELILKVLHPDGGPSTKATQEEALRVYNEATMQRGILVDAEMALPLLEAFCFPAPGEEPNVDRSMEIYSDLLRAETLQQVNAVTNSEAVKPTSPSTSSDDPSSSSESSLDIAAAENELPPLGPTVDVYDLLLNGIAASSKEKVDHPKAWKLLLDMKFRGIHFSNPTVVGHIKRFMTKASSHKEAFAMYNNFIELHPQSITADEDAFLTIVRQFIFSEWWKSETPPAVLVGNFINDARRSGFEPSHRVMTTLFSQYARVAYKDGMSLEEQETFDKIQPVVQSHVKTALAWCRIDPYIRFDRTLYNAIMIASARVGLSKDTYGTWLIVSESNDPNVAANNESVNIIFDSIRLHSDSFQAIHIFRWLRNGEFPLDLENWHSYIRCLLGCGDPDRAMDVAFAEMNQRTGFPAAPAPTWDTIRMILQYQDAYGSGFKVRIRKRIAREYPEWWEAGLKDETNIEEEKLVRMRDECNLGRGMVDLLPEPPEDDVGEEWGRRERERAEEKAAKERYRIAVMKASTPKRPILVAY